MTGGRQCSSISIYISLLMFSLVVIIVPLPKYVMHPQILMQNFGLAFWPKQAGFHFSSDFLQILTLSSCPTYIFISSLNITRFQKEATVWWRYMRLHWTLFTLFAGLMTMCFAWARLLYPRACNILAMANKLTGLGLPMLNSRASSPKVFYLSRIIWRRNRYLSLRRIFGGLPLRFRVFTTLCSLNLFKMDWTVLFGRYRFLEISPNNFPLFVLLISNFGTETDISLPLNILTNWMKENISLKNIQWTDLSNFYRNQQLKYFYI